MNANILSASCPPFLIIALLKLLIFPASLRAQKVPLNDDRASFERLVYWGSAAESDYSNHAAPPDQRARFEAALSQFSNVNDRLLNLVNHDFKVSADFERLRFSLFALSCRYDLTPTQLEQISSEITRFADDSDELSDLNRQMISGSLKVLANYPTQQHEELTIKFAKSNDIVLVVNAVNVLGRIGSERSVNVVAAAIQKRKIAMNGNYNDHIGSLMEASFKMLTHRINQGVEGQTPNLQSSLVKAADKKFPLSIEDATSVPWNIIGVLIVAATGLLWLLVKKRM